MGFNIDQLLDFEPASARCVKCLALLPNVKDSMTDHTCPVCGLRAFSPTPLAFFTTSGQRVQLPSTSGIPWSYGITSSTPQANSFLLPVNFKMDAVEHAKELAKLARLLRSPGDQPALRVLIACLLRARAFVHFTTWGISQAILGALAAISELVPVTGIASGVDRNTEREIEKLRDDFPFLDIRTVVKRGDDTDLIHTKLIVIDGLLAISGSPNLTTDAWHKTATNKERLDIVTDVQKVTEDNNRYFASHWAEFQKDFEPSNLSPGEWAVYQPGDSESVDAPDETSS